MDFEDTPAEATFRSQAKEWLSANASPLGAGDNFETEEKLLQAARAWQRLLQQDGFAAITLPADYGGGGRTAIEQVIFRQEQSNFDVPFGVYEIGMGMCIPTIVALGSEALKQRYVPPAIRGEDIWCQLFSEPSAGSDLAAVRTRAVRQGNKWIVNGQKIWTTGAQFSDYGLLLARTEPDAPKHAGLTLFIVDMKAPGISVRPIRMITGESEFNEVFFHDVEISDTNRLTEPGKGWAGARTTLMFERLNVGGEIGLIDHRELVRLTSQLEIDGAPAIQNSMVRERLANWYINDRALKLLNFQTLTALGQGELPGPEQSISKLVIASQVQKMADLALDLREEEGVLAGDDLGTDWRGIERAWSFGAAMRIAGGTDEILRNIISERVLGLPPEPRADLPTNQRKPGS
jgi:alkylation response protein AidB-like acyl-CoA dehydrogenase